jgi:DNA topoisomerase-1
MAAMALRELAAFESITQAKRNLRAAIALVSASLGNTPTICRKCYVHPHVMNGYLEKKIVLEIDLVGEVGLIEQLDRLRPEETALLVLLKSVSGGDAVVGGLAV